MLCLTSKHDLINSTGYIKTKTHIIAVVVSATNFSLQFGLINEFQINVGKVLSVAQGVSIPSQIATCMGNEILQNRKLLQLLVHSDNISCTLFSIHEFIFPVYDIENRIESQENY